MPEVPAVGAIAVCDAGLLLVRRGQAPSRGRWSLPGGRVQPGETAEQALRREVAEETGLVVEIGALVGEVTRPGVADVTYRIQDFRVTAVGGVLVAGDDASDVAWVPIDDVAGYPLSAGLRATLRSWNVI